MAEKKGRNMDIEARNTQHGSVYARGIWLAAVEFNTVKAEATGAELKIRVTNGERDLSESSIFAEDLELELTDGQRRKMTPLSGSVANGTYRVRLADDQQAIQEPHAVT